MTTEATTTATPPPAPATPPVDVKAITEAATTAAVDAAKEAAEKVSNDRLKQVLKAMTGEEDKPEIDPLTIELLKNPAKVLKEVKEDAKREGKEEADKADADHKALQAKTNAIAAPFFADTPGVQEHLDYVDALIVKKLHEGAKYEDACKAAFEETVKKLKIPTVSEAERNRRANSAAIPGMGGAGLPPNAQSFDDKKSSDDFLKGLQSRTKSFKEKKS